MQNSSVLDPLIYHYYKQFSIGNNDLSLFVNAGICFELKW